MQNLRLIIAACSAVLILISLFFLDFQNILAKENIGIFLSIFSGILIIIAMLLSNRSERKKLKEGIE